MDEQGYEKYQSGARRCIIPVRETPLVGNSQRTGGLYRCVIDVKEGAR